MIGRVEVGERIGRRAALSEAEDEVRARLLKFENQFSDRGSKSASELRSGCCAELMVVCGQRASSR